MTPVYETSEDRANQREMASRIVLDWGYDGYIEHPPLSPTDYDFLKDKFAILTAEMKVRTCPKSKYDSYMIDERKISGLVEQGRSRKIPALLFVRWSDSPQIYYAYVYHLKRGIVQYATDYGGRTGRNDVNDLEMVAHIGMAHFRPVKFTRKCKFCHSTVYPKGYDRWIMLDHEHCDSRNCVEACDNCADMNIAVGEPDEG